MIIILQTQFQCQAAFNYRHDSSLWFPSAWSFNLRLHDIVRIGGAIRVAGFSIAFAALFLL
jgi:hypothetical protein